MELEPELYVPTPKTLTKNILSRDNKLRIQTLYYTGGWLINDLLLQFSPHVTRRQVQYALETRPIP
jgi:hypothetical protein